MERVRGLSVLAVRARLFARRRAAQHRGSDQNTDAQGDADGDQRSVFSLRAQAAERVAAVAGAEIECAAAELRGLPAGRFAAVADARDHVAQGSRDRLADLRARRRCGCRAAAAGDAADLLELLLDGAEMVLDGVDARSERIGTGLKHGPSPADNVNCAEAHAAAIMVNEPGRARLVP